MPAKTKSSGRFFRIREDGRYLSYSRIADKLRCDYKHDLHWNRRIAGRGFAPAMDVGSACHLGLSTALKKLAEWQFEKPKRRPTPQLLKQLEALAARTASAWFRDWLARRGGPQKAFPTAEEHEAFIAAQEEATTVAPRAFRALEPARWETVWFDGKPLIEQAIVVPLAGWDGFVCHIDWVAHDLGAHTNWVMDWKFRGGLNPAEDEEVDLQLALYQKVVAILGIKTAGSATFQHRNSGPSEPKLNKDGSMSRARIATDWPTYEAALLRAKLNPDDYIMDMKPKLDVVFHRLDRVYRPKPEVDALWDNVVIGLSRRIQYESEVHERYEQDGNVPAIRSMGRMNCRGCWAREFCLAELRGDDTDWLLKTSYVDEQNPHERILLSPDDVEVLDG